MRTEAARSCLLFIFDMTSSCYPRSGLVVRIAGGIDFKSEHHGVILMDHVVAVHRIAAHEVAEAEEQARLRAIGEPDYVLAGQIDPHRRAAAGAAPAAAA